MHFTIDGQSFLQVVQPALVEQDAAKLAWLVSSRWRPRQLCPLLGDNDVQVRRVVALTLGLVGDRAVVAGLTRALRDRDAQVNEMAEHSLWSIWFCSSDADAAQPFHEGVALLGTESYRDAIERFDLARRIDTTFAEAYNQCAIAHFLLGRWNQSRQLCARAFELIPTHFGAIAGMGHCLAELGDLAGALGCYRRSLAINPRMEDIASTVRRLEAKVDWPNGRGPIQIAPIMLPPPNQ